MTEFFLTPIPITELEELIRRCVKEEVHSTENTTNREEEGNEFLTIKEAATFLKVSLVSIHNWKRDKNLPYYRLGRSIRFLKKDLIAFAEVRCKPKSAS